MSLVIDSIPLYLDAYGRDYFNFHSINKDSVYREFVKILTIYATGLPGILYCFITPVILLFKLFLTKPTLESLENQELIPLMRVVQNPLSRTLGFRVSLYPLAYSLCHSCVIITSIYVSLMGKESSIANWSYLGLSIVGIVNLLCFVMDPYIQESWNPHHLIIEEQGENDAIQGSYQIATCENNSEENSAFNEFQSMIPYHHNRD